MSNSPLFIKTISVYKLPGFPRGMGSLEGFAKHINIIAGPNGSGKSSTARLIRQLLWKQHLGRLHADMSLEIDRTQWEIHADSGHYQCLMDGRASTLSLPAADESKRYLLALHELITDNDHDLAALLIREASGGYDLPAAQNKLGYDSRIKGRNISELNRHNDAKSRIAAIETNQKQLKGKEDSLQDLKKKRQEAADATNHYHLYNCLIASIDSNSEVSRLKLLIDDFPEQLSMLTGEEYDRIETLETSQELNDQAMEDISAEIDRKNGRLIELGLPESGISKALLGELQTRGDSLVDTEKKLDQLELDIASAELLTDKALKMLSPDLNTNIKTLDVSEITDLAQFMEGAHRLLSEKHFLETTIALLKKELPVTMEDQSKLRDAIGALLLWFQERSPVSGISAWSLWVLLMIGAISALVTLFEGWIGLTGILAMVLFIFFALRLKPIDEGETRKKDFRRTGLPEPANWGTEAVAGRLEELNTEFQEAKKLELLARQLEVQESALTNLAVRLARMDGQRDEWLNKVGAMPGITQDELKDYSGFYWFLSNLLSWQQNFAGLKAFELQRETARNQQESILSTINNLIRDLGAPVTDGAEAKGVFRKLQDDETERSFLSIAIAGSKIQLEEKNDTVERLAKELLSIHQKLGLEPGQKQEIWLWNGQLNSYRELIAEYQGADVLHKDKRNTLQAHRLFSTIETEFETLSADEANQKCEEFKIQAARFEALNKEIIEIERDIENAMDSKAMEEALSVKNAAIDALEQVYQNNLSSLTGSLLVGLLKETYREQNNEGIFGRSNQLFSRITNGRFELTVEEGGSPSFRAYDTVNKNWLELAELSTGTRIQLLLAVRLSFIELQEQSLKLPILADEVLANSDDLRAQEIISALVEISKEGRQVFYFTAQADEIDKWKAFASHDPDLELKIFILEGKQNEKISYRIDEKAIPPSFKINNIPVSVDEDTKAYGKLLNVPPFNLLSEEPEQLHLWYLLEDNDALYSCLIKGISRFGQLKRLMPQMVKIPGMTDSTWTTIQVKVKLLESYIDLYRRGKAKPIDREVLLSSNAVSSNFIEAVTAKLKELDNDPSRLIEALKSRAVSGFLQNKIAALDQYFIEQGFIDERPPLSSEDLHERLLAIVSNLEMSEEIAEAFLNKVTG
jgi:energy-coupling factor transporter ATP-binding protein EcfA2